MEVTVMRGKKAQVLSSLGSLGIGIASFAILIAVIFLVTSQVGDQIASIDGANSFDVDNSTAANATKVLIDAVADIPGWVPLIVIVSIGGLILGMISVFGRS